MTDHPAHRNTAIQAYDIDEMYAAYCEFKNDITRSFLSDDASPSSREHLLRINRIMPKSEFAREVKRLAEQPDKLAEFRRLLADGWQDGRSQPFPKSFSADPDRSR
jgi:hypothetical protein